MSLNFHSLFTALSASPEGLCSETCCHTAPLCPAELTNSINQAQKFPLQIWFSCWLLLMLLQSREMGRGRREIIFLIFPRFSFKPENSSWWSTHLLSILVWKTTTVGPFPQRMPQGSLRGQEGNDTKWGTGEGRQQWGGRGKRRKWCRESSSDLSTSFPSLGPAGPAPTTPPSQQPRI